MDPKSTATRHLIPWITTSVFIVMIGLALLQVLQLRNSLMSRAEDRIEDQLASAVNNWEERLQETLSETLANAFEIRDLDQARKTQSRLLEQRRFFQQLHLWSPPSNTISEIQGQALWSYPNLQGRGSEEWHDGKACVQRAKQLVRGKATDRAARIERMEAACQPEKPPVQRYAAGLAAAALLQENQPTLALQLLERADVVTAQSPNVEKSLRVPRTRVLINQFLRAWAMLLGPAERHSEGVDLLRASIDQLHDMEPPNAHSVWTRIDGIQAVINDAEAPDSNHSLKRTLAKTQRRIAAYDVVQQKLAPQPIEEVRGQPYQFTHETLSSDPFLLFYGWNSDGSRGAALQLMRDPLLKRLLSSNALAKARGHLVILNDQGQRVAGSSKVSAPTVHVPLGRILPDHRIAIGDQVLHALASESHREWTTPLVMVILLGFLGLIALFLQFRASQQQLALLNRQRQFTTRVTHELKTPIAGIRLMAENLMSGTYVEPEAIRTCARSIVQESERLQARIEEVLQTASERKVPSPEPFDPEEALYKALDHWAPRLQAEGVKLTADLELTPMVLGDALALRDAVSALLDNALKYRDRAQPVQQVWMSMHHDERWVVIRIADNGLGVPEHMHGSIFEAFVRVEGAHRGPAGGHGLGLHQVAEIVQHHRGRVTCRASEHGGALFEIQLPAMDVTAEEASRG